MDQSHTQPLNGRKPTVNDIARVAGVSLATVDRVLNQRPGVRRATIEKVNTAIATLGYVRDAAAAFIAALRSDATGVYNIGGGVAWKVGEIAETVNAVFGNAGNIRYDTDSDAPLPQTVMALERAQADLGWQPGHDLQRGLEDLRATKEQDADRKNEG